MRFPSIFQENSRLSAQCSAQESVIEGLREERKLWGKELAHQGAALAQDRGRMEAQLDTLTKECRALQVHDMYIHMQEFLTHAIGHADYYDLHHRDLFKNRIGIGGGGRCGFIKIKERGGDFEISVCIEKEH